MECTHPHKVDLAGSVPASATGLSEPKNQKMFIGVSLKNLSCFCGGTADTLGLGPSVRNGRAGSTPVRNTL